MKEYLRTIHQRPEAHKKRFALLVSGIITLTIFAIWSFVMANNPTPVADNNANNNLAAVVQGTSDSASLPANQNLNAVTPFQDLLSGIGSAIGALKQSIGQIGQSTQTNSQNSNGQ